MNDFFNKANNPFETGNYIEAIEANPEYTPALFKLALSYNKSNDSDREIAVYECIIELKP